MRRPLELRTTLTGFPSRQFLDSAPSLSFRGASQFKANALRGSRDPMLIKIQLGDEREPVRNLGIDEDSNAVPIHVRKRLVEAVLSDPFVPGEVATPAASVRELIPSVLQRVTATAYFIPSVCSKSEACLHRNRTNDPPLRPQSPPPTPVNKSRRYSARGSHLHAACEHLLHSPEVADGLNSDMYIQQHFKRTSYLNSELPGGSNRNSGNGPIMVGRNNGALLSAPHAGHALQLHPKGQQTPVSKARL